MPHTKSAAKRAKQSVVRRTSNRAAKATIRTLSVRLGEAVENGDKAKAMEVFRAFASSLDKAAKRGTLTANNASRHKARASAALTKIKA
jgi:small subunit ribosomal protein S20